MTVVRRPITPSQYSAEELRKLNAEMLQLDNHRFLLTTTAVVLFGSVAGWVTTALLRGGSVPIGDAGPTGYLAVASTTLVCTVLLVLFYYQASQALTIRWLAAYQMLQGSSWEWTWYTFRKQRHRHPPGALPFVSGYRLTVWIFNGMMVVSFGYFLLLHCIVFGFDLGRMLTSLTWPPAPERVWILAMALLLLLALVLVYRRNQNVLRVRETECMKDWADAECGAVNERLAWGDDPTSDALKEKNGEPG